MTKRPHTSDDEQPVIEINCPSKIQHGGTAVLKAVCTIRDPENYTAKWQIIDNRKAQDLPLTSEKYNSSSADLKGSCKLVIKDVRLNDQKTYQLTIVHNKGKGRYSFQAKFNVHMAKDRKNWMQYTILNKDLGTKALKLLFNANVPPANLQNHLAHFKDDLRRRWDCKPNQMRILFPASPDQFDTTILYKLIRNTLNLPVPSQGWGKQPLPQDLGVTDDVERLRIHRNSISHDSELKVDDFKQKWKDLSEAIVRIGKYIGEDLSTEVQELKQLKLDSVDSIRLENIERTCLEIKQEMKDNNREGNMAQAPQRKCCNEEPYVLCALKRQRKCGYCDNKFKRPITPPKNFVFRQKASRVFIRSKRRNLVYDKVHYHIECVEKDARFKISPDIMLTKNHIAYFQSLGLQSLCDEAHRLHKVIV